MFSLGVILFEMCYPMKTGMERKDCLENITIQNKLPEDFDSRCKENSDLVDIYNFIDLR
jgi:hypothetical protein